MDAQTYSNITAACDQIAAKTQEPGISALAARLQRAAEREHKPTMALVSFNMNHAERFAVVKDFTGVDVPEELAAKTDGTPACILFDYNRTPGILVDGGSDGITVYGLPCEKLQNRRIAVCDAVKSRDKWFVLAEPARTRLAEGMRSAALWHKRTGHRHSGDESSQYAGGNAGGQRCRQQRSAAAGHEYPDL